VEVTRAVSLRFYDSRNGRGKMFLLVNTLTFSNQYRVRMVEDRATLPGVRLKWHRVKIPKSRVGERHPWFREPLEEKAMAGNTKNSLCSWCEMSSCQGRTHWSTTKISLPLLCFGQCLSLLLPYRNDLDSQGHFLKFLFISSFIFVVMEMESKASALPLSHTSSPRAFFSNVYLLTGSWVVN
jgi:hypothetical protein